MNHLRRASAALAAVALLLGATPSFARADTPTPSPTSSGSATGSPSVKSAKNSSWIRLDSLAPATIPTKGNIVITGTLHNGTTETWQHLSVEPANSYYPLSFASELDSSSSLDPRTVHLGVSMSALSTALRDLRSGGTTTFRIKIPRDGLLISGAAGAYWLGVTPIVDGQPIDETLTARTYFPLLPKANKKAHLDISLVVPLRGEPLRATNGQVADPKGFTALLSSQGRLGRIAQFGQTASGRVLTWLVDPALLDLADQTVNGVSDYGVGLVDSTSTSSPSPTTTASPSSPSSPSGTSTHAGPDVTSAQAATIRTWASSIKTLLGTASTYALPYGDPSVGALVTSGNDGLLRQAVADAKQSMSARGLGYSSAVAPATGTLSQDAWSSLGFGQTAFVNAGTSTSASSVRAGNRTLVVASPASDGGPGPSNSRSALNIRQRLLAEASLAITTPKTTSLTVVLPADWDPGAGAGSFFGPLSRSWISFTDLPVSDATQTPSMHRATTALDADQTDAINAAVRLRGSASRLQGLLATSYDKTTLMRQFSATELAATSYGTPSMSAAFASSTNRTADSLDNLLASVRVEGTQFVTLSGASGIITVAIHNGLNLPITVGLDQINQPADSTVSVNAINPTTFEPGERTTVRVTVNAPRVSVQQVTLSAVNAQGTPIGMPLVFTLRSSPVGAVVWAITIAIVLILVLIAGRRMRQRIRRRKAERTA
ncbi:MAG TPA: hypothetical protein VN108_09785 [Marmoricola sp.]|nr:hypothetical protein [Marmoricola sp.]